MAPAVAAGVSAFDLTTGAPVGGGKVPQLKRPIWKHCPNFLHFFFLGCCTDVYSNFFLCLSYSYLSLCLQILEIERSQHIMCAFCLIYV